VLHWLAILSPLVVFAIIALAWALCTIAGRSDREAPTTFCDGCPHETGDCGCHELPDHGREIAVDLERFGCRVADDMTGGRYFCTRDAGHSGPCAAVPRFINGG
jgi:hypothetical protein